MKEKDLEIIKELRKLAKDNNYTLEINFGLHEEKNKIEKSWEVVLGDDETELEVSFEGGTHLDDVLEKVKDDIENYKKMLEEEE